MPQLEQYTDAWIPAVRAFNERIAGVASRFALGTGSVAARPAPGRTLRKEFLLATDGDAVRGGIMLQHQTFRVGGDPRPVANIQHPVSEGLVDRGFAYLGMWIIKTALRPHPLAFAVGMGGVNQPLPKLLLAMGWSTRAVPFLFHVHRPSRFLQELPMLRRGGARRAAALVAAKSGAGWLGLRVLERWRARGLPSGTRLKASRERVWGPWADEVWERARDAYSLIAARDAEALSELYPDKGERYLCFRLRDDAGEVGWVVLLRTQMRGSDAFGNLIVGTVLDCLAVPGRERDVARSARALLDTLDLDVSVTNLAHVEWRRAFRAAGYLEGPSNYALAMSKALSAAVAAMPDGDERMHVTRGDGDGRIHL